MCLLDIGWHQTMNMQETRGEYMISFNKAPLTGKEIHYIAQAINSGRLAGGGNFSRKCETWFENHLNTHKTLMTTSCTHALEMAAILIGVQPDDEIIMPSYTFVSTANAFVLRGAKIVFVDIRKDTMNIDEMLIESAITDKTKAIVPVHYAGVSCCMDTIMKIADKYQIYVIEDAAQGMMSSYRGRALGTIGHLGAYSFHETKNYSSGGEGGLLLINDERFVERSEVIREKGTNRSQFFRGEVDKYSWIDIGSSYLPSELQAAYLWAQLEHVQIILEDRQMNWQFYFDSLLPLAKKRLIELPILPDNVAQNYHIFYFKVKDLKERTSLLRHLNENEIHAVFHYVPLHSSKAGSHYGEFRGEDNYTTKESERLIRLPMYFTMAAEQRQLIVQSIFEFYNQQSRYRDGN